MTTLERPGDADPCSAVVPKYRTEVLSEFRRIPGILQDRLCGLCGYVIFSVGIHAGS
jgi:hypothetical protein